jgi:acyl carrier protein
MVPSQEEIRAGLAEIFYEIAGTDVQDVELDRSFTDLDIDSLTLAELVIAAEDRFGVRVSDDHARKLQTVGDAVTLIQQAEVVT